MPKPSPVPANMALGNFSVYFCVFLSISGERISGFILIRVIASSSNPIFLKSGVIV